MYCIMLCYDEYVCLHVSVIQVSCVEITEQTEPRPFACPTLCYKGVVFPLTSLQTPNITSVRVIFPVTLYEVIWFRLWLLASQ